jgi:hypothetical protein
MANPSDIRYFRCSKRSNNKSCPGCGKLLVTELEKIIYHKMTKKLRGFQESAEEVAGTIFREKLHAVSKCLDNWAEADFDEKRTATDALISKIHATGDKLKIKWNV